MMDCEPPFSQSLLVEVRRQYRLDWNGLHGASHWARVREKGLHLCAATPGLRRDVVVRFALLHDACRHDDGHDGEHGVRAAEFVRQFQGRHIHLDSEGLELLVEACRTHTGGRIPAHPTVMACWDGDRLDLPRIFGVRNGSGRRPPVIPPRSSGPRSGRRREHSRVRICLQSRISRSLWRSNSAVREPLRHFIVNLFWRCRISTTVLDGGFSGA